jgi:predicted nucleotidyltransferase
MKKEEILLFLGSHKQEMYERFGVTMIGLFGSYARDEAKEDSDIDIAVEIEGDRIFRKFFGLEEYLKTNLHKDIDLGIASALKPFAREKILKEIEYV